MAVIEASGHCDAMRIKVAERPRQLMSCNCSICRRLGTLWADYSPDQVTFVCGDVFAYLYPHLDVVREHARRRRARCRRFPSISGDVGQLLLKDLVLLAASLRLLLNSLGMTSRCA
jgi:hypothetical protein